MKIALILCDGFEDIEALGTKDILNRAGIEVTLFGEIEIVRTSHNTRILSDELISDKILTYEKTTTNMIQKINPIFAVNPLISKEI